MGAGAREVIRAPAGTPGTSWLGELCVGPSAAGPIPAPLWIGMIAYDAGPSFEPALPVAARDPLGLPDAQWMRYGAVVTGEVGTGRAWAVGDDSRAVQALRRWVVGALEAPPLMARSGPLLTTSLTPVQADGDVLRGIERTLEYIRAGDIYQANITRRFRGTLASGVSPAELLLRGQALGAVPYAGFVDAGDFAVVSLSPECFLRADLAAGTVATFPIKGTWRRGATPGEDAALAGELRSDFKERAEHVMIVDLERNDLGRVCEVGSVAVTERWAVQSFPGLHHLVSSVEGRLREGVGLRGLFDATFPCGSITGAPKVRACQIIAEIEGERRGVYCGALGYLDPRGQLCLSVPIRTGVVLGRDLHVYAGGGIVADSVPEREVEEGALKMGTWMRVCG